MSDKFVRFIAYAALIIAIITGIVLTVVGNTIDGWFGVALMLAGNGIFITLLYLYNRRYR